ncbi:MAG: ribosomal L7Ae/L30e/S12e/Gadd45 family protein [Bacilli bacterium]|nr:ribosomal L7Ae/L30e/S12e/Gadd45 family protein [Bacilli bacterium]
MRDSLNFLGLLNRGGLTLVGDTLDKKFSKVKLLILAKDASVNTKKSLIDKANYYNVKFVYIDSAEELGYSLGFNKLSAVGIIDGKAAKRFKEKYEEEVV